jgi:uncharacterized protein YheU (UPF0270 family)
MSAMRDATRARERSEDPGAERSRGTSGGGSERGVEIDPAQLSPGALRSLIEEFVTREGTDYGSGDETAGTGEKRAPSDEPEWSLEDKVTQVYRQLSSGEARIVFDLDSESASILCTRIIAGRGGSSAS